MAGNARKFVLVAMLIVQNKRLSTHNITIFGLWVLSSLPADALIARANKETKVITKDIKYRIFFSLFSFVV